METIASEINAFKFLQTTQIIINPTKKEKKDHNIINGSRRRRIAMGSGTTVTDVNRVIKQYVELKKMLKMFKGKKMVKLPKFLPF